MTATGFMALWALAGAAGLAGGGFSLSAEIDARLPSGNPALAGLALVAVVGIPMTLAAVLAWLRSPRAPAAVLAAGGLFLGWIVVETAGIREVHWLQPLCFAYGPALVALAKQPAWSR